MSDGGGSGKGCDISSFFSRASASTSPIEWYFQTFQHAARADPDARHQRRQGWLAFFEHAVLQPSMQLHYDIVRRIAEPFGELASRWAYVPIFHMHKTTRNKCSIVMLLLILQPILTLTLLYSYNDEIWI